MNNLAHLTLHVVRCTSNSRLTTCRHDSSIRGFVLVTCGGRFYGSRPIFRIPPRRVVGRVTKHLALLVQDTTTANLVRRDRRSAEQNVARCDCGDGSQHKGLNFQSHAGSIHPIRGTTPQPSNDDLPSLVSPALFELPYLALCTQTFSSTTPNVRRYIDVNTLAHARICTACRTSYYLSPTYQILAKAASCSDTIELHIDLVGSEPGLFFDEDTE